MFAKTRFALQHRLSHFFDRFCGVESSQIDFLALNPWVCLKNPNISKIYGFSAKVGFIEDDRSLGGSRVG